MKVLRSISAVVLAALVLVSSTSFMVGVHVCMDEIQNVALFSKADGCEKEKSLPPCHRNMNAPCCEDETVVHDTDDFKTSSGVSSNPLPVAIDIEQPRVLLAEVIPGTPLAQVSPFNYDPPWRSCDRTVEHGVFLI